MSELIELSLRVFSELRGTERASTMQATIEGGSFLNSGQACFAGTRLLVPKSRLDEVKQAIIETIPRMVKKLMRPPGGIMLSAQ